MNIYDMRFSKVFIFLFLIDSVVCGSQNCLTTFCGRSNYQIRFPFRLENQFPRCGYPGFNLTCNSDGKSVINFPDSGGEFLVRDIDYLTQELLLYDPNNCLPRRFKKLNLSSLPFTATMMKNYTFLECPTELVRSRFTTIGCLSNSSISTLATSTMNFVKAMNMCRVIDTYPIPVTWQEFHEDDFTSALDGDLRLNWMFPNCEVCEASGGFCGYQDNSGPEILCYDDPGKGKQGLKIFRIIALSIVIPAVACSLALSIFMCLVDRRRHNRAAGRNTLNFATATITPQLEIVPEGLDVSTIESYKKVILGESRRVPGRNDITCPICLADYHPKETLRCLPDCDHCFHAECIDQWLQMNGTCPVCRNNPSPSPAHVNS